MPPAERTLRVDCVILRHSNWGEADRLLSLFTREAGKLRAVAKGARKLRSRKAGHLEPFTHVKLMLARGRDFWIVTQAETIDAFMPIRDDLVRTAYAAYVIELLDRFTYEEGENRALFQLLVETLQRVAGMPDPFIAVRYYEIQLLDLLGFRPQLNNCTACGAEIKPENQYFDVVQGGVLCPRCGPLSPTALTISMPALKYLRHFQRSSFREAARVEIAQGVRNEIESLLNRYFTYHLERRLNSPSFLHEVRRDHTE